VCPILNENLITRLSGVDFYKKNLGRVRQIEIMPVEIAIRPAIIKDTPVLVRIIRNAFHEVAVRFGLNQDNCPKHPSNCKPDWIEDAMAKGVRYFILDGEGFPCGCVALEQAGPEVCYLERLAVLPDQQRRGYGRALVDYGLDTASGLGSKQVDIGIIAGQTELKEWYKKIGFVEQRKAHFPHLPFEVLFMSKTLDPEPVSNSASPEIGSLVE
jgi:N-acetylglutamate synthase-like GNAT family acetyltransferase